jgi:hypothetical protein
MIRRREFITFLGGAAAWPVAGRQDRADAKSLDFTEANGRRDSQGSARGIIPAQKMVLPGGLHLFSRSSTA